MRAQAGVKLTSTTGLLKKKGSRVQAENKDQTNAVLACTTGLPLAEAETQESVDVSPQHRTRGAFELTPFCWTHKPMQRMGMPST